MEIREWKILNWFFSILLTIIGKGSKVKRFKWYFFIYKIRDLGYSLL